MQRPARGEIQDSRSEIPDLEPASSCWCRCSWTRSWGQSQASDSGRLQNQLKVH